ncbi:hypothetical protein C1752_00619 [Acaryochloris thomasi RCC1774]|uniref:Zinc-finger domain-containing protein n=1 Tax=Acaryochloris thomasi RCC1774 TaxID=1764569 RepID=A0A2W1JMW7_9CYAN|nr:hypothetical protein [Acaryochloris thomasi]PZD74680.1 hypothetical protein C1752_00619 [Acaryochloris thomasi RCC1774]
MFESLTPEQRELMAGYVLGEIDPDELAQVRELLRQYPVLEQEVLSLQDALGAVPLGLETEKPPAELRSRLLTSATPISTGVSKKRSVPWGRMVVALAVGVSVLLGLQNWQLRQQLATRSPKGVSDKSQVSALRIEESLTFEEILLDHQNSLSRSQGPADFATQDIAAVRSKYASRFELPTQLPQLQKAQLLGGSFCELSQIKGIRFSYRVKTGETLSFYQLTRSEGLLERLDADSEQPVLVSEEPNTFIWDDQNYLYILVGDLPASEMRQLAPSTQSI